jgi:PST family polysaccharide transporter
MRDFIKNTAYISMTEISLVIVAFVRNKFLAVKIGPEGFGIYGLLQSFFVIISIFSGVWISQGVTKYISEYNQKGDTLAIQKIATFAILTTVALSLLIATMFLIGRKTIIDLFLSEDILSIYFVFFTISFLGNSLRPIFIAIFQGLKKIKSVIIFRFVISITDILFVIILVSFFDLLGFFVSIFINSIIIIILFFKLYKQDIKKLSLPSINENLIKKLLLFGASGIILGVFYHGGEYILRLIVLKNINLEAVGLFTAAMAIVSNMGIINRGIMFNFFPEISEVLSKDNRNHKINTYLRFSLLINIPITAIIILFGKQIILLLLSPEFLPLSDIFHWFALVHFFSTIAILFYYNLMGMALIKNFTYFGVLGTFFFIIIPILLIHKFGLVSIAFGYLVSYAITIPCYYWFLYKKTKFRFSKNIYSLFFVAALAICIAINYKDSNLLVQTLCGLITLLLVGLLIKKEEYNLLFSIIGNKLKKNN